MISAQQVKELREATGAGMMDCKKALVETNGDMDKAIDFLREKGLAAAAKKAGRIAAEGIVESYIHGGGKIGVLVTFDVEGIDPASDEFQHCGRDVAMQVAAASPVSATRESVPAEVVAHEMEIYKAQAAESGKPENIQEKIATGRLEKFYKESCLTEQAFVKNPDQNVTDYVNEVAKKLGGTIKVTGFKRFMLGE